MCLETSDLLWLSSLSHGINGISDSHLSLDWLKLLIESDEHSWIDRKSKVEEEVVILSNQECLHVSTSHENCQQTCKTDI